MKFCQRATPRQKQEKKKKKTNTAENMTKEPKATTATKANTDVNNRNGSRSRASTLDGSR